MNNKEALTQIAERSAHSMIAWNIARGFIERKEAEQRYQMAFAVLLCKEQSKLERNFTMGPPTDQSPFVGCNEICTIGFWGTIPGPNDHCLVVRDSSGPIFFCDAPEASRLSDGSLPLCSIYKKYSNKGGIKRVKSGRLRAVQTRYPKITK